MIWHSIPLGKLPNAAPLGPTQWTITPEFLEANRRGQNVLDPHRHSMIW
jgi:hypothetical protein